MSKFILILAIASSAAVAQVPPAPEPAAPMVATVRPPLGAASRASRHEEVARERGRRAEEKAEDRAEAEKKRKESARSLKQ